MSEPGFRIPPETPLSVLHYAVRLVRHCELFADMRQGMVVAGIRSEPSDTERERAVLLLENLLREEGATRLQQLPVRKRGEIVARLAAAAVEHITAVAAINDKATQTALRELRQHCGMLIAGDDSGSARDLPSLQEVLAEAARFLREKAGVDVPSEQDMYAIRTKLSDFGLLASYMQETSLADKAIATATLLDSIVQSNKKHN